MLSRNTSVVKNEKGWIGEALNGMQSEATLITHFSAFALGLGTTGILWKMQRILLLTSCRQSHGSNRRTPREYKRLAMFGAAMRQKEHNTLMNQLIDNQQIMLSGSILPPTQTASTASIGSVSYTTVATPSKPWYQRFDEVTKGLRKGEYASLVRELESVNPTSLLGQLEHSANLAKAFCLRVQKCRSIKSGVAISCNFAS